MARSVDSPTGLLGSLQLDTEEGRAFLQSRVGRFAMTSFVISAGFLVAGNVLQLFLVADHGVAQMLSVPVAIHTAVTAMLLVGWRLTERVALSLRALAALEVVGVVGVLSGFAAQLVLFPERAGPAGVDSVILLITFTVLTGRAVLVPSSARTTFLVSTAGVIPALVVAVIVGRRLGEVSPSAALVVPLLDSLWCVAAVGLSTRTSRVIYGLRAKVVEAERMGQYVLEKKIGEGGMGTVYLAHHALLRRPTAIKLLPPDRAGVQTIARFEREVQRTSMLSHPNTVAIFDYGRTPQGIFYYAMEYLEGLDLQRLVERFGPQSAARTVHILAQMCGALGEAHKRGLVHRDVKPANAVLCERGGVPDTIKVLDFGLVKDMGTRSHADGGGLPRTDLNTIIGTPAYLAPEAIASPDDVDARSDIYAIGAVGYFLLVGEPAFVGRSLMEVCAKHLHDIPVRPSVRLGKPLPTELEEVLLRCLEKQPDDRPRSASVVRDALLASGVEPWSEQEARAWWGEHELTAGKGEAVPSASRSLLAIDLGNRDGRAT